MAPRGTAITRSLRCSVGRQRVPQGARRRRHPPEETGVLDMTPSAIARTHWVLGLLPTVAAAGAAPAHSEVAAQFLCGFQASWSTCGFSQQAKAPDRITLVEVAGRSGVRLRTMPGDQCVAGSGGAERADMALSPEASGCSQGQEQWWAHSLLFPPDYEVPVATPADPWPWGVLFA